ncbi:MAG TPA: carboxypeptidase-like regulatory domain-containing protein, partial [Trueperaceae bacterium]
MKHIWYVPLLLGLVLVACSQGGINTPPSGKGVINGLVTDSGSGARLEGVKVTAAGKTVVSDEAGQFSLSGLPAGEVMLSFELADYAPGYANAMVGDQATPVLVTLKQQGALQAYNAGQAATLYQTTEAGPYAVIFEPNSLATSDTNLRVSVTPLDPTKEASALPGELVTSNAILSPLTFAEFSIFDSAG